jgi:hypothetical protein
LEQAIEAGRQTPLYHPLIGLRIFGCENAAEAEREFSQLPETFTTREGTVIPLREKAIQLARSLAKIEKQFTDMIWPQHRRSIEAARARISEKLGSRQEEFFGYFTTHLGMETANYTVPIYLVAEGPWPAALTVTGEETNHGVCVINVGATPGSDLFNALLHESIHALDARAAAQAMYSPSFRIC